MFFFVFIEICLVFVWWLLMVKFVCVMFENINLVIFNVLVFVFELGVN